MWQVKLCSVLCLPVPERTLVENTLPTVVSSLNWFWWRGMLWFSDLCSLVQSWAGTWRGWPWLFTNERAMQAIPERAGEYIKMSKSYRPLKTESSQLIGFSICTTSQEFRRHISIYKLWKSILFQMPYYLSSHPLVNSEHHRFKVSTVEGSFWCYSSSTHYSFPQVSPGSTAAL